MFYGDSSWKSFVRWRILQLGLLQNPADIIADLERIAAAFASRFPGHELQKFVELKKMLKVAVWQRLE